MNQKGIGKIERLPLRTVWKDEARNFTVWLESNLEHLTEALGFELEIHSREHAVGSFSIDLLCKTRTGEKVIIENQLEKTDHSHLGQILTYMVNIEAKTVIWISSDPRQEHVNVINWLNEQTSSAFYLVKVEAISISGSAPAPLFSLICEPDEELKSVSAHSRELTDRESFNLKFWESLTRKCSKSLPHFSRRKPNKYHFLGGSSGKGGLSFVFLATKNFYGVELYIDRGAPDENEKILQQLLAKRVEVERALGATLIWDNIEEKRACRIRWVIKEVDVTTGEVEKIQENLISSMMLFENVFRPIVRNVG
jgi:hypothetical protein